MHPAPTPPLPPPAPKVRWRDPRHARALCWEDAYGPGPFEVVRVVDKSPQGIPPAVVVKTRLGDREINEVWLTAANEPEPGQGYSLDVLLALDDEDAPLLVPSECVNEPGFRMLTGRPFKLSVFGVTHG
jgi:hypothetical protein